MQVISQIEQSGFAIAPALLGQDEIERIKTFLDLDARESGGVGRGGTRDVLDRIPALRDLTDYPGILRIVHAVLGSDAFVARATLFDKTPESNWKVPWHQDVTIAVKEKREVEGYGPWSIKAGVNHVQPPTKVLEQMLTVRVHIDPCPATNGALRVMPGSHRLGRLDQNTVEVHIDEQCAIRCVAEAGDALVMRPLLLHASSASENPGHRRVLHFDYAIGNLTDGLEWHTRKEAKMA